MRIAVVQFAASEAKAANLQQVVDGVESAADRGATLVIAPEAAMHDFGPPDRPLGPVAEPIDGPFVAGIADVARRRRLTVVAGMFEAVPGDGRHAFNTIVAIGPDGDLLGSYRKQHLFDALGWEESARLLAGEPEQRLVLPCEDFTIGVLTCYDIRFPELSRALVDDGATLLAVPAAWVAGPHKQAQWSTLIAARAIENVCYVAAADQSAPTYAGSSSVVDPLGVVLTSLGEAPGVAVCDVAAEQVGECRSRMPSLTHRRWRTVPR